MEAWYALQLTDLDIGRRVKASTYARGNYRRKLAITVTCYSLIHKRNG